MGIEPFLVSSALDCVVAQRLARLLCSKCKRRTIIPAEVLHQNGYKALVDLEAYEPKGCRRCGGSGYRGRIGLYEVMCMSPEVQTLALERQPAEAIRAVALAQGMVRLRDDGLQKVRQGRTSMAEIARSTHLPIATGERVFTKWGFREVLEKKAATILQPDLCHAGGITEVRLIAGLAEAYYATIAPHNPLGPISLAAGVQLAASIPNFLCQMQR